MPRVPTHDPDQLAYRRGCWAPPAVGVVAFLLGLVVLSVPLWFEEETRSLPELWLTTTVAGGCLTVFGVFQALARTGVVLDRRRGVGDRRWRLTTG